MTGVSVEASALLPAGAPLTQQAPPSLSLQLPVKRPMVMQVADLVLQGMSTCPTCNLVERHAALWPSMRAPM